jgi:hypothetical protein
MREKVSTEEKKKPKSLPPFGISPPPAFDSGASVVCARLFLLHRPLDHSSPPPTASLPRRVFIEARQAHWPQALPNWDYMFLVHGEGLASGTRSRSEPLQTLPNRRTIGKRKGGPKKEAGITRIIAITVHRIPSSDRAVAAAEGERKEPESKPDPFFPSA